MTNVIQIGNTQRGFTRMDNSMSPGEILRLASNRLTDEILPADLSAAEIRILLFVFNRTAGSGIPCARVTGEEASDAVGVDRATAARAISRLLRRGFLYRIGGSRGEVGITCLIDYLSTGSLVPSDVVPAQKIRGGFIYMLANSAMPGIFKVGMTRRLPEDRADELSKSTSSPAPFEVVHAVQVAEPLRAERLVHELLSASRISSNREFFRITLEQFVAAVDAVTAGGAA